MDYKSLDALSISFIFIRCLEITRDICAYVFFRLEFFFPSLPPSLSLFLSYVFVQYEPDTISGTEDKARK